MGVSITLVFRPSIEALGPDWAMRGWRRLAALDAAHGGRLPRGTSLTAGLRLRRTDAGLSVLPVIPIRGRDHPENLRQVQREMHQGRGTLWLSDPQLRALEGFTLRWDESVRDGLEPPNGGVQGRWRRCLPKAGAAGDNVGAFLPHVDAGDPFWQGLDALHCGSFFRYDADAEIGRDETIISIGDVAVEDEAAAPEVGRTFAGWWNPIVLQFRSDDVAAGVNTWVAGLLEDRTARLDIQVTLARAPADAADGALAARFWLHEALRRRAHKARVTRAPLPALIFGPDAQPQQTLAFLLLDLLGGSFLLDVACGNAKRPTVWLAPAGALPPEVTASFAQWLCATCCKLLGVEAAKAGIAAPLPIEPVALGTQPGIGVGGGAPARDHPMRLAAVTQDLDLPTPVAELARALDHPRMQQEEDQGPPGVEVAAEAAAVLREALAPGTGQAGGRVALLESIAGVLALPRSAILLRFPPPPDRLGEAQHEAWQADAERYCISLTKSARAPGYWWLTGLGDATPAEVSEPPWNVHEVHWASQLYRAAFVQAAPEWRPSWYVDVATNSGLGDAMLGEMILGAGGGRAREPTLPGCIRIANVPWNEGQGGAA